MLLHLRGGELTVSQPKGQPVTVRSGNFVPLLHADGLTALSAIPLSAGRHTPDGIRMGRDGSLYIALSNGGGVWVLDQKGALSKTLDVPGEHHSNLSIASDGRAM